MDKPLARVVIRAEGEHYLAYFAGPRHFGGAVVLGSVHIGAVHRHQHRMRDWIDLMRHLAWELAIDAEGEGVKWNDILIDENELNGDRI